MKRIALFMDGTWDSKGSKYPSNIEKLYDAVAPVARDGVRQLAQYQKGIGASSCGAWRIFAGATAAGLDTHVQELYSYLVQNYVPGDEIYLFGFSRGAYTARCLAGLIRNCGILTPEFGSALFRDEAYALYLHASFAPESPTAIAFRKAYCYPEFHESTSFIIHFIGVFDTVGALGVPGAIDRVLMRFHDTALSRHTRYAYQALAIDEHRAVFNACPWRIPAQPLPGQNSLQVWFPGAHCDVGGGYAEHGLADCTLAWMTAQAMAAGLDLDPARYREQYDYNPRPGGTLHNSNTLIFKLLRPQSFIKTFYRRIDDPPAAEEVSEFVLARERYVTYDPPNLVAYRNRPSAAPRYAPSPGSLGIVSPGPIRERLPRARNLVRRLLRPRTHGSQDDTHDRKRRARSATIWNGTEFVPIVAPPEDPDRA